MAKGMGASASNGFVCETLTKWLSGGAPHVQCVTACCEDHHTHWVVLMVLTLWSGLKHTNTKVTMVSTPSQIHQPHHNPLLSAFSIHFTHRWMEDTDDGWQSVMVKANTRLTKHSHNSHHQQWAEPQTPCLQSLAINTKHKWGCGHKVVE